MRISSKRHWGCGSLQGLRFVQGQHFLKVSIISEPNSCAESGSAAASRSRRTESLLLLPHSQLQVQEVGERRYGHLQGQFICLYQLVQDSRLV